MPCTTSTEKYKQSTNGIRNEFEKKAQLVAYQQNEVEKKKN